MTSLDSIILTSATSPETRLKFARIEAMYRRHDDATRALAASQRRRSRRDLLCWCIIGACFTISAVCSGVVLMHG